MYHSDTRLDFARAYQDELLRNAEKWSAASQNPSSSAGLALQWNHFRFHLGEGLIAIGERIRCGAMHPECAQGQA